MQSKWSDAEAKDFATRYAPQGVNEDLAVRTYTTRLLGSDPRMVLQDALARHNIEKNPADFEAHYNLAAMLQSKNQADAAIAEYQAAVRLQPDDAVANNALGAALTEAGHPDQAVVYLKSAFKARADYFDAHYNLGIALATQDDFEGAAGEFQIAARLRPQTIE